MRKEDSDYHHTPGNPDSPLTPLGPGNPLVHGLPFKPGGPGSPAAPLCPENPGLPGSPDRPGGPPLPLGPGGPGRPLCPLPYKNHSTVSIKTIWVWRPGMAAKHGSCTMNSITTLHNKVREFKAMHVARLSTTCYSHIDWITIMCFQNGTYTWSAILTR